MKPRQGVNPSFSIIRIIIILLFMTLPFLYHQTAASAADLKTQASQVTPNFWDISAPPAFSDNNAIQVILDQADGNWRYYIAPYLNLEPHENKILGIGEAYLAWEIGDAKTNFGFDIGRKLIMHGAGRYGYPVLGPLGTGLAAEGYDQAGYHFAWGILKAQKFYALVSESAYRMLIGQRVTLDLGPITLGASEDVLVTANTPWYFYIPIPFNPNGNIVGGGDNKIIDCDLAWRMSDDFKFYGEYFIDDIPMYTILNWTPSPDSDKFPWLCGYQGGIEWRNAFNDRDLTLYTEYTKINQYTYTHSWDNLNWTYHGDVMGDSLGPDADRINCEVVWQQSPEWQWSFAYQRVRRGQGKIGDHFIAVPGQTNLCLTGIVEITDLLAVGATHKIDNYEIGVTLGLANIQNANHVAGDCQLAPKISVNAKIYLP